MNAIIELKFAKFLAIGVFLTTIFVLAGPVTDPVNVTKFLVLTTVSFGMIPFLILNRKLILFEKNRLVAILAGAFLPLSIVSMLLSDSPLSQNLYGVYGRNTGLITLISFFVLMLCVANFKNYKSFYFIVLALGFSSLVNVIYGIFTLSFGDPIPWNNPYGGLLGTFGNPNFSGAFYGVSSSVFLAYFLSNLTNYRKWSFLLITYIASCVCIFKTNATQGILVFCLSNFIVVLLFLRIKAKAKTTSLVFAVIGTAIGSLVVLGIFQIGPLSQYLYKRTVSLRGSYWNAAYETGKDHMFAGVGFDAFGDWYRRSRSEKAATWLPGPDVVVNAAHNYFLDFFASGGILLFAIFSVLNLFAILSAVRIIRTLTTFEVVPIILISAYFGFLAQSLVSISQIGVGVWNWILIGALIGFSQITETSDKLSTSRKKISANINQPIGVFIFIGMSVGFTLSVPPFSADVKWMNALKSQDIKKIELALQPSYFNPSNSFKYGEAISLLERNKFFKEAHVYSLASVSFNPELYELWRTLYYVTNSTPTERNTALKNMKRLDPLNSKLRELK